MTAGQLREQQTRSISNITIHGMSLLGQVASSNLDGTYRNQKR